MEDGGGRQEGERDREREKVQVNAKEEYSVSEGNGVSSFVI